MKDKKRGLLVSPFLFYVSDGLDIFLQLRDFLQKRKWLH